ncbi:efflux RND transporter permease subunit [Aureivirga sp. CE67]|uniref:efflux RND transporter permease subunit n=1 Tax=Aureivirga sp. CE67 TaxID=1788983 RepID=UPI0018C8F1F4|nr:efflux RND transporter permease subunit [Aureivirga sp. CE67]
MENNIKKYFGISSWSINNRMTVFVIMAILLIGGLMSYMNLPREAFPEIVESKIYVSSIYPGNAAEDVEKLITKELEDEIKNISGVDKITSNSLQDYSMVMVEFDQDITPEEAKLKVQDKVDIVKGKDDWPTLDSGAKVEPNVFDLNISEATPMLNINLTGDFTKQQLKDYAEFLEDEIEDLPEIKEVDILGVQDKEVEVAVNIDKMAAANVSLGQVIQAIKNENVTISGGNIVTNDLKRNIRVIGEIKSPEEIENFVVKRENGLVFVKDIAKVIYREKDKTTYAREYEQPVVMLDVKKKSGKNMIVAAEQIRDIVKKAKAETFPEHLNISITNDQSTKIEAQVAELENSIIFGILLVVGVLMFFLGFRNAMFVGIAIPLSMLMSFMILPMIGGSMDMNITLNTMVLFASVMGLGMLVDNGIVVVENVYRLMDQGVPRMEAAKQGVGEIAWPIIASTATTLAAFLPLGLWPGVMGKFMIYFPLTLGTVLASSLFVALIINAMLTSVFMKTEEKEMTKASLIRISGGLGIFGILLTVSGLFAEALTYKDGDSEFNILLMGIGSLLLVVGLVSSFIGWKNRSKTALLKKGMGMIAMALLLILVSNGSAKTFFGFGNLFILLAILLWIHKYFLLPASETFQFKLLPALENKYESFLKFALRGSNSYKFFFGTFGLLILSFIVFGISNIKTEFFPANDPNQVIVYIEYPEGTDIEKTREVTESIEGKVIDVLSEYDVEKDGKPYNYMAESIISQVGQGAGNPQTDGGASNEMPQKGKVTVMFREFKYRRGMDSKEVMEDIREAVKGYPGVSVIVDKNQDGPPPGYAINLEISGEDYNELMEVASGMRDFINQQNIPGIEELKLDVNVNKPELEVYVDREKAGRLGVSTAQIGMALRQAIYGIDASTYKDGKDDHDIYVRFDNDSRYNEDKLFNQSITFRNNQGKLISVPISSVISKRKTATFSSIKRKNTKRLITVYSNVLGGFNATEVVGKIDKSIKNYKLPNNVTYKFTGEQEEMQKNMSFLSKALLIAIALIMLIIVAQFNSISKPVIIITAVILSFIGVLFGLVLSGMSFVVIMTMLGIISLAGIVVNNAIVLIDYTQLLIDRKKEELNLGDDDLLSVDDYFEVIVAGGKSRLRPVLLTAITTVLGLIPLAVGFNIDFFSLFTEFDPKIYFGGDNSIFWKPMSWTIIYGLTFATFLTLVIVPVMFYLLNRAKVRFKES